MKKILFFLLFAFSLFLVDYWLVASKIIDFYTLPTLFHHAYIFVLYLLGMGVLLYVSKKDKDKIGYSFLGMSIAKMLFTLMLVLIELYVLKNDKFSVLHLVTLYLVYLLYFSVYAFQLLQSHSRIKKV